MTKVDKVIKKRKPRIDNRNRTRYKAEYYEINKEMIKKRSKMYRKNNKNKIKEQQKKSYKKNKIKINYKFKKYYHNNRDKINEKSKEYSKKNRDKINKRLKNKRKTDPIYRLICHQRNRKKRVLKNIKIKICMKECLTESQKEIKEHFENLFKNGMTWENMGKKGWVVDHVKPIASFNLEDPKQQKICFGLNNLQPLWDWENGIKSDCSYKKWKIITNSFRYKYKLKYFKAPKKI